MLKFNTFQMAVILSDMPDDVLDNFRREKVINVAFVRQLTPIIK